MSIATATFGRTEHDSSRTIFGAAALSEVSQDDADATLELIRSHGVNHIDVAASYGEAELRLGPHLAKHRDDYFLATKTGERTRALAFEEIERSLERLQTDHIDLIQLHNLVDEDEWETAFAGGGAIEAVVEAQAQGMVRYIGVTGHGLTVARQHLRVAGAVPLRLGAASLQPPDDAQPRVRRRLRGAAGRLRRAGRGRTDDQVDHPRPRGETGSKTASTWYEPLTDPVRDRPRGVVGARTRGRVPEHGRRHHDPAGRARRRGAVQRPAGRGAACAQLEASFGLEPLFS